MLLNFSLDQAFSQRYQEIDAEAAGLFYAFLGFSVLQKHTDKEFIMN